MSSKDSKSTTAVRRPFTTLDAGYKKLAALENKYEELVVAHEHLKRKRTEEYADLAEERSKRKVLEKALKGTLSSLECPRCHSGGFPSSIAGSAYEKASDRYLVKMRSTELPGFVDTTPTAEKPELSKAEITHLKSDQGLLQSTISQNEALIRDRDMKDEQIRDLQSRLAQVSEDNDKHRSNIQDLKGNLAEVQETIADVSEKLKLQTESRRIIIAENDQWKARFEQYRIREADHKMRNRQIAAFLGISKDDLE